jgi:hypothetical protein
MGDSSGVFKKSPHDTIDQRPQQARRLQAGDLLMFKGMLNIRLDARQVAPESANGGIARHHAIPVGEAGERVR